MSAAAVPEGITPEQANAIAELVRILRELESLHSTVEQLVDRAADTGLWAERRRSVSRGTGVETYDEFSVFGMVDTLEQVRRDLLRMVLVPLGRTLLPGVMGIDKPE